MKRLMTAFCVSLLLVSSPGWAGGGHGHGKHGDKHEQKEWKKERKAWQKEQKHWAKHGHGFQEREVVVNHYYPAPRVVEHRYYVEQRPYSSPPGVYVSMPSVYIPWSN
jgi:hypothetical protein